MINSNFVDSNYWSDAWVRHLETYLSSPPRCGIWLKTIISDKSSRILECAGGSCRDSRYLFSVGFKAMGSDFDHKTLEYVREKYAPTLFEVTKQDAFKFTYNDNEFDVVYHNGFWILFEDDRVLASLFKEQVRISKTKAIILVHNSANINLVKTFHEKSKQDDLYQIRFFDVAQLEHILKISEIDYKSYRIAKFGGTVDVLYGVEKRLPILSPLIRWLVPRLYRFQPWSKVERIALIVELE